MLRTEDLPLHIVPPRSQDRRRELRAPPQLQGISRQLSAAPTPPAGGRGVAAVIAHKRAPASNHALGAERGLYSRGGGPAPPCRLAIGEVAAAEAVIGGLTAISSNGNKPEALPVAEAAWRGDSSK